jgi:hypothetical protein
MRTPIFAVVAIAGLLAGAQAHADDIDFTFTGSGPYSTPPGTISGELLGVADNGTSTPTGVILFSDPDGIPAGNLTQAGWFYVPGEPDTITLSHGVVTSADFTYFSVTTNQELILGAFGIESLLINYINGDQTGPGVVTYTQAIDEPGSLVLLAMGGVFLAGFGRRLRAADCRHPAL